MDIALLLESRLLFSFGDTRWGDDRPTVSVPSWAALNPGYETWPGVEFSKRANDLAAALCAWSPQEVVVPAEAPDASWQDELKIVTTPVSGCKVCGQPCTGPMGLCSVCFTE